MVVVSQKIGTLCIDYRPHETVSKLCFDEGMFNEDDCDTFVLFTKFDARFTPLLPVYALDSRCYSRMHVKCFSIFDALDFVDHLSLAEFDLKFVPSKFGPLFNGRREELDIIKVFFSGSLSDEWALRIDVAQKNDFAFSSNYAESASQINDFNLIYERND